MSQLLLIIQAKKYFIRTSYYMSSYISSIVCSSCLNAIVYSTRSNVINILSFSSLKSSSDLPLSSVTSHLINKLPTY